MTKKILITRFPYEAVFSGEEIHTLLLAEKLREKNYQIIFAGSCPVLVPEFKKRGFDSNKYWGGKALVSTKSFWLFCITFPFVLVNFFRLAWLARFKYKTDLIYMLSLNEKLFLTPWLVLFGIKTVWVEHSRIGDWLAKNPFLFIYKFLSKFVKIISVSKITQSQLIHLGVSKKQITFILNGVDFAALENVDLRELKKWQQKNLASQLKSKKTRKIGLITRLYHDKGVDYFMGAFREIAHKYPDLEAFIVGEGPSEKEFKYFAKDLPVTFLGKIPHQEIKYFLNSIDYFILPSSSHDPFGLAPAEAMVCEKPVIVTNLCGISEFMQNEKDGLIIPASNTQAIIHALEKVLNDSNLAKKIANSGQNLAIEKFSLERMVGEYEQLF